MDSVIPILLILGALLAGAMSPGPSFVVVANIALGASRNDGVAASLGMGAGSVILSLLALMGLHAILVNVPSLYITLKVFGGLYLIYLAIKLWRGAKKPFDVNPAVLNDNKSLLRSFFIALFTQISNPKAAIVYGGIFAALLPQNIPASYFYILPPLVFVVEAGWYLLVTLALSSSRSRSIYLRSKAIYDRITSIVLAGLGARLVSSV